MTKQMKLGLVLAAAAVLSAASMAQARGWVQEGSNWYYYGSDNELITETIQSSGTSKFYLGEDGSMQRNYFLEDYNGNSYYFGSNGAMVTNTWVAIDSSIVENTSSDYVPDAFWYYFQSSGKAMRGANGNFKKATIDGKKYIFNENGQMSTGWIDGDGLTIDTEDKSNPFADALYYAGDDNDGVLRTGWITYYDGYDDGDDWVSDLTNLYFYFNPSNNKKTGYDGACTKKVNGKTYAFNSEGIMLSGWDAYEHGGISSLTNYAYFSGEDDGHQVKKGWVYAVPAEGIDAGAHADDEEKYMYFNNSGDIEKDTIKKINGKFYCFNGKGIMKTGLVVWNPSSTTAKYVDKLDMDYATGREFTKAGIVRTGGEADEFLKVDWAGKVVSDPSSKFNSLAGQEIVFHYFGSDGARRTGTNQIEFSDDVFNLYSKNSGAQASGASKKKYYANGISLVASSDIKYGLFTEDPDTAFTDVKDVKTGTSAQYVTMMNAPTDTCNFIALTTSGSKQKGADSAKKDADGNYWLIDKATGYVRGIWSVGIKYNTAAFTLKGDYVSSGSGSFKLSDFDDTLYVAGTEFEEFAKQPIWEYKNTDGRSWTSIYTGNDKLTTYWFQSDYNDSSNKWIPCGLKDDAGKTCSVKLYDPENENSMSYEVKPNSDYFLNSYYAGDFK